MQTDRLKIIPLGGLGEIGMNCLLYEWRDEAVMIDCGIMFHDKEIGVDFIHPSFEYLLEGRQKLRAVILTHGHEDHMGAIPFLYQHMNAPLYGSPFVLKLIEQKIKDVPVPWKMRMSPIFADTRLDLGPFQVEFAGVNHSIPQSLSVFMRTPAGNILHTSDFKIGSSTDPDPFERKRFEEFRRKGVDLLLSDSTNIEREGFCPEEATATDILKSIMEEAPSRVFVTLFPSNIRRIHSILGLADILGRKVVLLGRSMENYVKAARAVDLLPEEGLPLVDFPEEDEEDDSGTIFLVSGSQGEPGSTLTKIAAGRHRRIRIGDGDLFIYSSRHIPGNEMRIGRVMNEIARRGGKIFHTGNREGVHASGHACRGDLEEMLKIASPSSFIPLHGTYHYMAQHSLLAAAVGIRDILVVENGESVEYSKPGGLQRSEQVPAEKVYVEGMAAVEESALRERKDISCRGAVVVVVVLNKRRSSTRSTVRVSSYGVIDRERSGSLEQAACERIEKKLDDMAREGDLDPQLVKMEVKKSIEKLYIRSLNRRPFVKVEVMEMQG